MRSCMHYGACIDTCHVSVLASTHTHTVGGLHDTVFDVEFSAHVPKERRNGFHIQGTDGQAVQTAVQRAADAYHVSGVCIARTPNPRH